MQTLFSQPLVEKIKTDICRLLSPFIAKGEAPQLGVVLVGNDPASLTYISVKSKFSKEVGITFSLYHLEEQYTFEQVKEAIDFLNADPDIHGIILQLPLPPNFASEQVDSLLRLISPEKDVDGLSQKWLANPVPEPKYEELIQPLPSALPPIVLSVTSLLDYYQLPLPGKRVVVVGRGRLVGGPLTAYLEKIGVAVESVDIETDQILERTKTADVLITGTGEKELITYQWVKEGVVVLDCSQDVHADSVGQVAAALSPAKGGVGPLTVAWLMHNTAQAFLQQTSAKV